MVRKIETFPPVTMGHIRGRADSESKAPTIPG
jgi:hypothetical protein